MNSKDNLRNFLLQIYIFLTVDIIFKAISYLFLSMPIFPFVSTCFYTEFLLNMEKNVN